MTLVEDAFFPTIFFGNIRLFSKVR